MSYNKRAATFLPQDLQDAINTFVEQFNIMEAYNLETIPTEYLEKLFRKWLSIQNIIVYC